MAEKVDIQSSGLAFLFPRYSLGKCSAFESHLRDSKIDLQKEVYFANWRKRWVFYRPASHFFFLAKRLRKCLAPNPILLKRWKRWRSNRPAFAFLFPRYTLGKCSAFESHLHNKKAGTSCPLFIMAEKVGFEPTCGCPQTLFESAPLRPLRYFSIPISFFSRAVP